LMRHKDALECIILLIIERVGKSDDDIEKIYRIWTEFLVPWFNLPVHWFLRELNKKSDKNSCIVKYAPGQKIKTIFGDGTIVSVIDNNYLSVFQYKVKLQFGLAFIRPSAILHLLPLYDKIHYARHGGIMELINSQNNVLEETSSVKLPQNVNIIFGTEKIYLFMRLYCLLVSLFLSTYENLKDVEVKNDFITSVVDCGKTSIGKSNANRRNCIAVQKISGRNIGYLGMISSLKEYIKGNIGFKDFESCCRALHKEKVYEFAALPRLLEKCADALLKVSRENMILSLFDFSQVKDVVSNYNTIFDMFFES